VIERFKVERTSVDQRASWYAKLEQQLKKQIRERKGLSKNPSRETAADIIAAVVFDRGFTDVVNTVNVGQIANLPQGATVETMGYVDAAGVKSFTLGPLPEPLRALCAPHAEAQVKTVEAGLSGDVDLALMALVADPACSHMTVADIKKMGMELLRANKHHLPQFFG
jgi:alpha-galactosidase